MSSQSERRPVRRPFFFSAVVCGLLAAGGVSAQQHPTLDDKEEPVPWNGYTDPNVPYSRSGGHAVVVGGHASTGVASVVENHGPNGATIRVTAHNLPADASAQISFGALQDGFEVIETGYTDAGGRFNGRDTVEVTIPEWAKNDRPYLLIVSDVEYHPFAPAEMVHPTDARGMVRRTGTVRAVPEGCMTLTGQADELYFLSGDTAALQADRDARIEGRVLQDTHCGVGTTIEVHSGRTLAER